MILNAVAAAHDVQTDETRTVDAILRGPTGGQVGGDEKNAATTTIELISLPVHAGRLMMA